MWGRCGDTAGDGGDGEQGGVAGGDTLGVVVVTVTR